MTCIKVFCAGVAFATSAFAQNSTRIVTLTEQKTVVIHLSLAPNSTSTSSIDFSTIPSTLSSVEADTSKTADTASSTTQNTVVVQLPANVNATKASGNSNFSTQSPPPTQGSNGTISVGNGTNDTAWASAKDCNNAILSWSDAAEYTVTTNRSWLFSSTTYWTEYPNVGNATFTLCDGYPRAHGTPVTYSSNTTSTSVGPTRITKLNTITARPSCIIDSAGCSRLWSSYDSSYTISALKPACESPSSACDPQTSFWTGTAHPSCLFAAEPVQLVYFPVSTVKGDRLCGTNYTTVTSNVTAPVTVEALGTTFTSGTAYISFPELYAHDRCGSLVGTKMESFFLPLPSSALSSRCGEFGFVQFGPTSVPLNFADLNTPVALSVYSCMAKCEFGVHDHWKPQCPTIWDDYAPALAYPTDYIQKLQPEWANCGFDEMLLRSDILYDPPIALSQTTEAAAPTLPAQTAHSTTALPPATPAPTRTTMVVVPDESTSVGESEPEETGVSDPSPDNEEDDTDPAPGDENAVPTAGNQSPQQSSQAAAIGDAIASAIGLIPQAQSTQAESAESLPTRSSDDESDDVQVQPVATSIATVVNENPDGSFQVGTQVLDPGSAITVGQVTISLVATGSAVVVNGATATQGAGGAVEIIASVVDDQNGPNAATEIDTSGLVSAIASAAAAENPGPGTQITVPGSTLAVATNEAGAIVLGGSTLVTDGVPATIAGQTFSVVDGVLFQDGNAVATATALPGFGSGSSGEDPLVTISDSTLSVYTNSAGAIVVGGSTLADNGSPVTIAGQVFSVDNGGVLYQDGTAVATATALSGGSLGGSYITIAGEVLPVSTNEAGAIILDGNTSPSDGSPVTIDGLVFSVSGSVIYQGSDAIATLAPSAGGSYITVSGEVLPLTTNSAGGLVVDGTTLTPGASGVVVDGVTFSLSDGVLYGGTHALTTLASGRSTVSTASRRTTSAASKTVDSDPSDTAEVLASTSSGTGTLIAVRSECVWLLAGCLAAVVF